MRLASDEYLRRSNNLCWADCLGEIARYMEWLAERLRAPIEREGWHRHLVSLGTGAKEHEGYAGREQATRTVKSRGNGESQ